MIRIRLRDLFGFKKETHPNFRNWPVSRGLETSTIQIVVADSLKPEVTPLSAGSRSMISLDSVESSCSYRSYVMNVCLGTEQYSRFTSEL